MRVAVAISSVLSLAVAVLWGRSLFVADELEWSDWPRGFYWVHSVRGNVRLCRASYLRMPRIAVQQGGGSVWKPVRPHYDGFRWRRTGASVYEGNWTGARNDRAFRVLGLGGIDYPTDFFLPTRPTYYGPSIHATVAVSGVSIPYWLILAGVGAPTASAMWRTVRGACRRTAGRCPGCGYDVRASPETCPECGEKLEPFARRKPRLRVRGGDEAGQYGRGESG